MSRWIRIADVGGSYTIQGQVVGLEGIAEGIVVRPDRQSEEEIMNVIENLSDHSNDALRQRQLIPDWALNRGGSLWKRADEFRPGPGGVGVTMAQSLILVAEWVTTDHTWLLLHPKVTGIVAEKGGGTSHGAVIARQRNIPIIVDATEAKRIQPKDNLRINGSTGIIDVNGGDPNFVPEEAQVAEDPIFAFVWSRGQGLSSPIEPGSEGAIAVHAEMAMRAMEEGWFDPSDTGMGVIFENGKVQLYQYPTDQDRMVEWLNTIHPVTEID